MLEKMSSIDYVNSGAKSITGEKNCVVARKLNTREKAITGEKVYTGEREREHSGEKLNTGAQW